MCTLAGLLLPEIGVPEHLELLYQLRLIVLQFEVDFSNLDQVVDLAVGVGVPVLVAQEGAVAQHLADHILVLFHLTTELKL